MRGIILAGGTGSRLHPITLGGQQAADAGLRQADDLLPALDADAGRHPRRPGHHHPARRRAVPAAARRRLAVRHQRSPTPCSPAPTASPRRSSSAPTTSATTASALVLGDNIFYGAGPRHRSCAASTTSTARAVFGYRVADPTAYGVVEFDDDGTALSLEEKPAEPEEQLRRARPLLLRQRRRRASPRDLKPSARGELEITDLNRHLPRGGHAAGRGAAARHRLARHRHLRRPQRRQQLRAHHRAPAGAQDRLRPRRSPGGWASSTDDQLAATAPALVKSGYGTYLLRPARAGEGGGAVTPDSTGPQ